MCSNVQKKYFFKFLFFKTVENLLNKTSIKVGVYSTQYGIYSPTLGTTKWIDSMKWKNKDSYKRAFRIPFAVNGLLKGYIKESENFVMMWINQASHRVLNDNTGIMRKLLKKFMNFE